MRGRSAHQLLQRRHQFFHRFVFTVSDILRDTGSDVICQEHLVEAVQCRSNGRHLGQNIDAVGIALQHSLDTLDLTRNAV